MINLATIIIGCWPCFIIGLSHNYYYLNLTIFWAFQIPILIIVITIIISL